MASAPSDRPSKQQVGAHAGNFAKGGAPGLDDILAEIAAALENVRDVLAEAVENFPGLDRRGELTIAVREIGEHSAYVRARMSGRSSGH